ncbi:MAG TPA: DinB family protein [Jatrophihabitans sp.]|nr:DinB family protein [Jatrophihabitans sp.]
MTEAVTETGSRERADLLDSLDRHRFFLRHTLRELSEEQIRQRSTISTLTLGGLVKHVTAVEQQWARFITEGPSALGDADSEADLAAYAAHFQLTEDDTAASLLDRYAEVAAATNELLGRLPDLDAGQPLPRAPWFAPGATWSARRTLLHIIAETAQHAGHADIIRESLDGAKTMG